MATRTPGAGEVNRLERIALLHRLLAAARSGISAETLRDRLECSRPTLYRDLAFLRDVLGAPLQRDPESGRWAYARDERSPFELPGIWLGADELYALAVARQLLSQGDSLLADALGPLQHRLGKLLGSKVEQLRRVRVLRSAARRIDEQVLRQVASALLDRRRIEFRYRARSTDQSSLRRAHPQRLTHYRDNWYLEAWDEQRQAVRSFALDRIREVTLSDQRARDLAESELEAGAGRGYGIFAGPIRDVAVIRFSAHAARWVADERWHPEQKGRWLSDGSYELRVPYANQRELLMDVLRFGADAEVIAPVALREQIRAILHLSLAAYG